MSNRNKRDYDLISSKILMDEYFEEHYEFNLDLFLKFLDDNCKIYMLDTFSRKGTQILNNFNITTKPAGSTKEIDKSDNFSMIAIDYNRTNK